MNLSSSTSTNNSHLHPLFLPPRPSKICHFRFLRRRRLKPTTHLPLCTQFPSPFDAFFHELLSPNSLNFIAPALGLASGLALYLANRPNGDDEQTLERVCDIGEWVLFTSPTPFNRFVLLRCPSIFFEGSEFLEDVNERLVKEDRHFVRLDSGRMQLSGVDGWRRDELEEKLEYQRVCVATDDGGVVSLDWPENLDLKEERGLDTTLLLVPGTTEGSMDSNVRSFVCQALKSGFFPIVMNPRGCAGSPLTTARLFTAADSDDICTAIQFISKARPWTTLMGVGWGYGANMLTKYLAEVGEKTPLTAATCIDNPFYLEEASRASSCHISVYQKLLSGMKDILRSNKELFQGKTKGFDVEKALLAKSVRDFEKAISMVSHGFEAIEDFYSESSTRGVVGNVKVPVLFIQTDDDGTVPQFSIPRSLIAENPYTSLLLCSCSPPMVTASGRSAISWCQHLTVEWLTAVELGLLKGRHPLLKDIDVTIKPSKGLSLVDGKSSDKSANSNKFLNLTLSDSSKGYSVVPSKDIVEESDTSAGTGIMSKQRSQRNLVLKDMGIREVDNGVSQQTGSIDAELVEEEEGSAVDSETGQVLQTTQFVMNMLDTTMPGTLTEEKKKKVLAAVGQGETLITALQDAVPEDVRGKLTASVSAFMQTQGTNLKLDGLLKMSSGISSGVMSRIQENGRALSSAEGSRDHGSSDQMEVTDNVEDSVDNNQLGVDNVDGTEEAIFDEHKDQDGAIAQVDITEDSKIDSSKEKPLDSLNGQNQIASPSMTEELLLPNSEAQPMEGDSNNLPPAPDQSKSMSVPDSSNFSVTQALDALTGMDDSTQVAVNSVFGVIEDMITQLEDSNNENETTGNDGKGKKVDPLHEKQGAISEHSVEKKEETKNELSAQPDTSCKATVYNSQEISMDSLHDPRTKFIKEQPMQNPISVDRYGTDGSQESSIASYRVGEKTKESNEFVGRKFRDEDSYEVRYAPKFPHYITAHPYEGSHHNEYKYPLSKIPTESLDVDSTTALLFDYFPEEGQWKLLEQPADSGSPIGDDASSKDYDKKKLTHLSTEASDIEPSYVVLDTEEQHEPLSQFEMVDNKNEEFEIDNGRSDKMNYFVRSLIIDSLKVEVDRKLSATDIKEIESYLTRDMELVADAVSLAVGHDKELSRCLEGDDIITDCDSKKLGTLNGEHIITAISSAFLETNCLRKVLPVGVIVGSSLAALRKFFDVAQVVDEHQKEGLTLDEALKSKVNDKIGVLDTDWLPTNSFDESTSSDTSEGRGEKVEVQNQSKDAVMAGAVTAALGASAFLVQHQDAFKSNGAADSSSKSLEEKDNDQKVVDTLEEAMLEKSQNNIVTSLAEKAMSVAGPVVPTKDGEVDQERLVALLADLGQRGGMLRLVGKVALLWGGIRGAMSLTEKLILFLHIAERPLFQRIIGFVGMTLVLWSPVVIPLLPTLMHCWTTHTSSRFAELACVFGLYAAILILVVLWGKRIRGFENPLEEYGLDMTSWSKIHDLLKGIIGGVLLVLSIHSVNSLLGYVSFAWPPSLPSSSVDVVTWLKVYGHMLLLVGRGIMIATSIAVAEELLFRSWLPEEIATDLGYHRGIIISGLTFALIQRSPWAIPGLWLLSFGLAGARQRSGGSLSIPIGLRAGIIGSSYILQKGGFLTSKPNFPLWLIGSHPFQPFSGVVGFAFSLLFAITLYPRQRKKSGRMIRE